MADFKWATDPDHLCGSKLLMTDDHWGAITHMCDLATGHEGDHAAELRACIPTAVLIWPTSDGAA